MPVLQGHLVWAAQQEVCQGSQARLTHRVLQTAGDDARAVQGDSISWLEGAREIMTISHVPSDELNVAV